MLSRITISLVLTILLAAPAGRAAPPTAEPDLSFLGPGDKRSFEARDTLAPGSESSADAMDCLSGLIWPPGRFQVSGQPPRKGRGEVLLRFPSPVLTGDKDNDRVAVEWYVAGMDKGAARRSRAVVVIHESGRAMTVGRLFARTLRQQGLHAFLVQLPGYGQRVGPGGRPPDGRFFDLLRQAIGDVRRTRDAIVALPLVDSSHVSLQGTSLGGFVVATSASLDRGYDSVFVMLAGGNLYQMIQNGKRDTAKVRQKLTEAGITGERLKQLASTIEPTRVAHRLDPKRTWLFSGVHDTVVPMASALALAKAAKLPPKHHVKMPTNHYTGIVLLPSMCQLIAKQVKTLKARKR